jgi:exopolyphosphatase/pppGpp-phosphohydrolase
MHVCEASEAGAVKRFWNVKLENKKSNSGYTNICQYNLTHLTKMDKLINGCMNDGHTDSLTDEKVKGITVGGVLASNSLNAAAMRQLLRLYRVAYSLNKTSQAFPFNIMNFSALLSTTILHYFSAKAVAKHRYAESCIDQ